MRYLLPLLLIIIACACSTSPSENTFTINPTAADTITTASGLQIIIPVAAFTFPDGTPPNSPITVELREVLSKSDMIRNNISTVANNQLIESLSMFYIRATSDRKELKLQRPLEARIPPRKADTNWELFYGQQNDSIIEWANEPIVERRTVLALRASGDADTISNDQSELESLTLPLDSISPYSMNFSNLGWINCDRFINIPERSPITFTTTRAKRNYCYLVFDKINSVMIKSFNTKEPDSIPNGYSVTAMTYDCDKDHCYFAKQQFVTGTVNTISFDPKPISRADLDLEFTKLDSPKK